MALFFADGWHSNTAAFASLFAFIVTQENGTPIADVFAAEVLKPPPRLLGGQALLDAGGIDGDATNSNHSLNEAIIVACIGLVVNVAQNSVGDHHDHDHGHAHAHGTA
ncbi:hypothetical protein OH492_26690 [Vibrio chagasii]|nr:hypothetical protein [Vibrio chagasii]